MADLVNLWGESDRSIIGDDSTPTLTLENTSTGEALKLAAQDAGPALDVFVSGSSGTVLKINNIEQGYVSTNSTASLSYAVRVDVGGSIFYVPAYLGKA